MLCAERISTSMPITLRADQDTSRRAVETAVGMTDVEFETARRAVSEERDHRLWLGDVFGRIEHPEVRHWAKRLSKSVRTAREYPSYALSTAGSMIWEITWALIRASRCRRSR